MSSITVSLDLSELHRQHTEWRRQVADGLRFAVKAAVEEGAASARQNHPYTDRSGDLTEGTQGRLETFDRDSATGVLESKQYYASFVDGGTSRSKAYPFMGPAYIKTEQVLERELGVLFERAELVFDR